MERNRIIASKERNGLLLQLPAPDGSGILLRDLVCRRYSEQQEQAAGAIQSVNHNANYNGNINGTMMSYNFGLAEIQSGGAGFDEPTLYGYTYDNMNRLIKADATVGDYITSGDGFGYEIGNLEVYYDKIGNIKSLIRNVKGNGNAFDTDFMEEEDFTYSYAAGTNRLMSVLGQNAYTQSRSYTYDPNGNVLTDAYRNINATEYGRAAYPFVLTNTDNGVDYNTNFLYSVNDQRIFKSIEEVSGTEEDYYLVDALGKTIAIWHKGTDATQTWEYFVSGSEREVRIVPTEGVTLQEQSTFYLYDHLGNTRITYKINKILDPGGTPTPDDYLALYDIKSVHDYFPYGKVLREFSEERYLTTQHERDKNTGLDYRGARYYDSDLGRFLSIDPKAKAYPSLSDYVYVADNPVKFIDPDGKAIKPANQTAEAYVQSYYKEYSVSSGGGNINGQKIFGLYSTQVSENTGVFSSENHNSPVWTSSYTDEKSFTSHLKDLGIKKNHANYGEIMDMWKSLSDEDVMEVMVVGPDQNPTIENGREGSTNLSGTNHYLTQNPSMDADLTSAYSGGLGAMSSIFSSPSYYSNNLYGNSNEETAYSNNIIGCYVMFLQPQGTASTKDYNSGETMQGAFNRNMDSIISDISKRLTQ